MAPRMTIAPLRWDLRSDYLGGVLMRFYLRNAKLYSYSFTLPDPTGHGRFPPEDASNTHLVLDVLMASQYFCVRRYRTPPVRGKGGAHLDLSHVMRVARPSFACTADPGAIEEVFP